MPWAAGKRYADVIAIFALLGLLCTMDIIGTSKADVSLVNGVTTEKIRQQAYGESSSVPPPADDAETTPKYVLPVSLPSEEFSESSDIDNLDVSYVHVYLPSGTRLKGDPWSSNETSSVHRTAMEAINEPSGNGGSGSNTNVYIIAVIGVAPLVGAIVWCVRRLHSKLKKSLKNTSAVQLPATLCVTPLPTKDVMTESPIKPVELSHYIKHTSSLEREKRPEVIQAVRYPSLNRKNSHWEIPRSELRLLEVLGEGNFGQVWKAEAHHLRGAIGPIYVAVKCIKENATIRDREDLLRELDIMKMLGPHPNVVTLLGCCTDYEPYYVIMEFVVRGKLLTYLRDHRSRRDYYNCAVSIHSVTSHDLAMFAYHIAKGMEYISSRGIVHRDLAARNILVDHNKVCKVADFGLSRSVQDRNSEMYEQKSKGALPIRWMAPESLYMNIFTTKSDVWAFGIVVWETVTLGSTPYPGLGAREVIQMVREGYSMEQPHHCRPELYHVMRMCWVTDPNARPNFTQLRIDLGKLVECQAGYVDLDHFPDNCYYNVYYSSGERV